MPSDSDFGRLRVFAGGRAKTGGLVQLVEIFTHRSRDLARIIPFVGNPREKPGLAAGFFIANRKAIPKRLVQYFATIGAGGGVKSNL